MKRDSFGDRIKGYEACYSSKWPEKLPLILRLDGKSFHTQVKRWKCEKPFDDKMIDAMALTAKYLCENISGAKVAYTQSDEITILIRNDDTLSTQAWFGNEINKILSISSAKCTKAFIYNYFKGIIPDNIEMLPEFDCRGFVVPEHEIENVFIWRQEDCTKNSIQMLARSKFSHKRLHGLNTSALMDLLMNEHSVNWNDLPTHKKRGICVVKKEIKINEETTRNKWMVDLDIPIFTKERDYIRKFSKC